jgi:nicotinamide-nucleotide amidase
MDIIQLQHSFPFLVQKLAAALVARNWQLTTAESCTGGGVATTLTDMAGSSQWFERGFVTYSNLAKQEMLGVSSQILSMQGAVSEACVEAMASGALAHSHAQLAVAVSGIAGPSGASVEKPLGMVCLAWQCQGEKAQLRTEYFSGDRAAVRALTIECALSGLLDVLENKHR